METARLFANKDEEKLLIAVDSEPEFLNRRKPKNNNTPDLFVNHRGLTFDQSQPDMYFIGVFHSSFPFMSS